MTAHGGVTPLEMNTRQQSAVDLAAPRGGTARVGREPIEAQGAGRVTASRVWKWVDRPAAHLAEERAVAGESRATRHDGASRAGSRPTRSTSETRTRRGPARRRARHAGHVRGRGVRRRRVRARHAGLDARRRRPRRHGGSRARTRTVARARLPRGTGRGVDGMGGELRDTSKTRARVGARATRRRTRSRWSASSRTRSRSSARSARRRRDACATSRWRDAWAAAADPAARGPASGDASASRIGRATRGPAPDGGGDDGARSVRGPARPWSATSDARVVPVARDSVSVHAPPTSRSPGARGATTAR